MGRRMRAIRGAIGIGVSWALGWAAVGAVIGFITGTALGSIPLQVISVRYAVLFAVMGFVGGALFSMVLRTAERPRSFEELSLPRFTLWGALGGLALGSLATLLGILGAGFSLLGGVMIGGSGLLGAGSAAGSLALARRADGGARLELDEMARPETLGQS